MNKILSLVVILLFIGLALAPSTHIEIANASFNDDDLIDFKLSDSQAVMIGTTWIILTILFEFIAGHYLFGNSWDKLISDYNILDGRIWSLVLLTTFIAPYLTNKLL